MMTRLALITALLFAVAACDPTPPKTKPQPAAVGESTERASTKSIEASSMVGYDGKQLRNQVDKSLDKSDAHTQQTNQALKDQ